VANVRRDNRRRPISFDAVDVPAQYEVIERLPPVYRTETIRNESGSRPGEVYEEVIVVDDDHGENVYYEYDDEYEDIDTVDRIPMRRVRRAPLLDVSNRYVLFDNIFVNDASDCNSFYF
jgi:hypothetical protein